VVVVDCGAMPEHADPSEGDLAAAIDAAQQQLEAAASSTLDEHLRLIAQQRVDEELKALRDSGMWKDAEMSYVVSVRRVQAPADG
jgi:hypothetical protein